MKIPKDKRDRIISAGIKEFADNGYALASTNRICENARISKGLLFHYFDSKSNFYKFLGDYLAEEITPLIDQIEKLHEKNFISFIKNVFTIGYNFWLEKADLIGFYERVKSDRIIFPLKEINTRLQEILCQKITSFPEIRKDLDICVIYDILINDISLHLNYSNIDHPDKNKQELEKKIKILLEGISIKP